MSKLTVCICGGYILLLHTDISKVLIIGSIEHEWTTPHRTRSLKSCPPLITNKKTRKHTHFFRFRLTTCLHFGNLHSYIFDLGGASLFSYIYSISIYYTSLFVSLHSYFYSFTYLINILMNNLGDMIYRLS